MQNLHDDHFAELRFIVLPRKCIHCGETLFLTKAYINVYNREGICSKCGRQKYFTEQPDDSVKAYKEKEPELIKRIQELKGQLEEKRKYS